MKKILYIFKIFTYLLIAIFGLVIYALGLLTYLIYSSIEDFLLRAKIIPSIKEKKSASKKACELKPKTFKQVMVRMRVFWTDRVGT